MAVISVLDLLSKVFGPRGIPFPGKSKSGDQPVIATGYHYDGQTPSDTTALGTPIKKYDSQDLGRYVFLPATIDGKELPNPLVIISGEKAIEETDVVDVGTVFERVFTRPYDITIVCTLIGDNKEWPEGKLIDMFNLYKKDDVVTLKCALTDIALEPKNNFIITRISVLDAQGSENVEIVQIEGRSNIDFELELI